MVVIHISTSRSLLIKMVQKKVFEHREIELCNISKNKIDTLNERYVIILDCDGKKIEKVKFYKPEVINDVIKGKGKIITRELFNKQKKMVGNILENLGLAKPVYEVS